METFLQGRKLTEVFSSFDVTPVGAGCVAQVHRAVLRADAQSGRCTPELATEAGGGEPASGAVVAVKVKRRGVDAAVARDLRLMRSGAALVAALPIPGIRCVCVDPPPLPHRFNVCPAIAL
jgi:predicted unusual protein kinase regulating ubiquinone biosynthesis (AarF/ABC1/UbiB family)